MKNIYYWCPFVGNIATIQAVINSAHSLVKYSDKKFSPLIINSCGEWDDYKETFKKKKIRSKKLENFFLINKNTSGYLKSRITYIKIFLSCFFSLKKILKIDKPEYLIAHLITSLPIFLFIIFRFQTKLIIRISGKVKMNVFRKFLWKLCKKKIEFITCPTEETYQNFIRLNILDANKIIYLPDPIIDISEILNKKKDKLINLDKNKDFFVTVGRYTKQKNHLLAIKCFAKILKINPEITLYIIGDGELKKRYMQEISNLNLNNNIKLISYQQNIPKYLDKSLALISTSLWEDPGFVMIEAAACNTFIISSNCSSGPKEFVGNNNGILFENNNIESLEKNILKFLKMDSHEVMKKKIGAKKNSTNFTKFRHFKILSNYLI
jgi:glycosyltransferase involved in cell wall biosynthesis